MYLRESLVELHVNTSVTLNAYIDTVYLYKCYTLYLIIIIII